MRAHEFIKENLDQVETPQFKAWFGNSKLRNDDGTPMRLYHATSGDFSAFKAGGNDPKMSGPAIWLSPYADHQAASHNIRTRTGFKSGTNVMPVYARMQRPLVIDDKDTLLWAREVFSPDNSEFPQIITTKNVAEITRDGEYDGIWFMGEKLGWGKNTDEIIVFSPNQVKSAIGNSGEYNPDDSSIIKENADQVNTSKFKAWFSNSKITDPNGKPLRLYRGIASDSGAALNVEPRASYSVFASDSPYVANTYANPDMEWGETGSVIPLYVKADRLIEFPVTVDRHGIRKFDKFEFDRRANSLRPGEVLVARQVIDIGPRANVKVDPKKLYTYYSDIYAWGRGTSVKSAIGNSGEYNPDDSSIIKESGSASRLLRLNTYIPSQSIRPTNNNLSLLYKLLESKKVMSEIGYAAHMPPLNWSSSMAKTLKNLEVIDGMQIQGTVIGEYLIVGAFTNGKPDAYLVLNDKDNSLHRVENVTRKPGQLTVIFKYILSRLGNIIIPHDEPLTENGIKWVCKLADSSSDIKVTDGNNKVLSARDIMKSWEESISLPDGEYTDLTIRLSSKTVAESIIRNMKQWLPHNNTGLLRPMLKNNGNKRLP